MAASLHLPSVLYSFNSVKTFADQNRDQVNQRPPPRRVNMWCFRHCLCYLHLVVAPASCGSRHAWSCACSEGRVGFQAQKRFQQFAHGLEMTSTLTLTAELGIRSAKTSAR